MIPLLTLPDPSLTFLLTSLTFNPTPLLTLLLTSPDLPLLPLTRISEPSLPAGAGDSGLAGPAACWG